MDTTKTNLHTNEEIQEWIISYLANLLEIDEEEIDIEEPFDRYGLDSAAAIGLLGDLGTCLKCDLDPTLIYDFPTIETLVNHLISEVLV